MFAIAQALARQASPACSPRLTHAPHQMCRQHCQFDVPVVSRPRLQLAQPLGHYGETRPLQAARSVVATSRKHCGAMLATALHMCAWLRRGQDPARARTVSYGAAGTHPARGELGIAVRADMNIIAEGVA